MYLVPCVFFSALDISLYLGLTHPVSLPFEKRYQFLPAALDSSKLCFWFDFSVEAMAMKPSPG